LRQALRNAGRLATVSARALMQRVPNFRSGAHGGTRPQRASTHSRSPSAASRTIGARSVGRQSALAANPGTAGTLNFARIAAGLSDRS
jgi:hypothetical protein